MRRSGDSGIVYCAGGSGDIMAVPNGENIDGVRLSGSMRSGCDGISSGADIAEAMKSGRGDSNRL